MRDRSTRIRPEDQYNPGAHLGSFIDDAFEKLGEAEEDVGRRVNHAIHSKLYEMDHQMPEQRGRRR